jgi:predicted nucleic acid-binding protein
LSDDVVADSSVVVGWFYSVGEEEVESSRTLLRADESASIHLYILDLTLYEVGNALLIGRPRLGSARTAEAIEALVGLRRLITPDAEDLREAARLAEVHNLTFYDAAYAAVAVRRGAYLATLDSRLLASGLGQRPSVIVGELGL